MGRIISLGQIFDNETIAASGTALSPAVSIFNKCYYMADVEGKLAIQYEVTGTGTLKLELEGSLDATNYVLNPNGMSAIVATFGATSGPGGDGKDIATITGAGLLSSFRIKATEDGGTNPVTVTAWMVIQ